MVRVPVPVRDSQLSAAGDSGQPEVVADPQGVVAGVFSDLGACVVQQCAKLRQQGRREGLGSVTSG